MNVVYDCYKPLRNYLQYVPLVESLEVIRAFMQYLQFDQPFPNDIQVSPSFLSPKHWVEKRIFPWELDVLAREIILNSPDVAVTQVRHSLKHWSDFSRAVKKIKKLEDKIAEYSQSRSLHVEFYRIAHRQFPWQLKPNGSWLIRYYKIFKEPCLNNIIQRVMGLNTHELYTLGLALTGLYLSHFSLDYPPNVEIEGIDPNKFNQFVEPFAYDLSQLREKLAQTQQYDENYFYTFNPMRARPLIKMKVAGKPSLVCPIPTFLFRRFTEGVFYEICNEPDFGLPYGRSFQSYIGEVISFGVAGRPIRVQEEREYYDRGDRKDTIDWIVDEGGAAIFVECKAKRLRNEAKIDITSTTAAEELDKMADFILQVYRSIRDYRDNKYPGYQFDENRKIYPVILTLEEWFPFGNKIYEQIDSALHEKLKSAGLKLEWLNQMPYSICSVQEFERGIQVIVSAGIESFFRAKMSDPEKRVLAFHSYIIEDYKVQYRSTKAVFPRTLAEISPETLFK